MNTNKRKGFTLVELLVVIAILAILATVSVVGYTSFIERANVSNDETLASQLNSYLEYLKVDSSSEYYNVKVDADNVWYVTQHILEESGVGEKLVPQSLGNGYNFYFDFEAQKYVLLKEADAMDAPLQRALAFFFSANAEETAPAYKKGIGNSFTKDGRYFLADTEGSPVANVINAFYKDNSPEDKDFETFLKEELEKVKSNNELKSFVEESVIVTKDKNITVSFSGGVQINAVEQGDRKENLTIHPDAGDVSLPANSVKPAQDTTIIVPSDTKVISMGIDKEITVSVTVHIQIEDITHLETEDNSKADAAFVPENVTITISGQANVTYKVVENKVHVSVEGEIKQEVAQLAFSNPISDFDISANVAPGEHQINNTEAGKLYIDGGILFTDKVQLIAVNEIGKKQNDDPNATDLVSKLEYIWSFADGVTYTVLADGSLKADNGVVLNPTTGEISLDGYDFTNPTSVKVAAINRLPKDGNLAANGEKASAECELYIGGYSDVKFSVVGAGDARVDDETKTFSVGLVKYDEATTYDFTAVGTPANATGITLCKHVLLSSSHPDVIEVPDEKEFRVVIKRMPTAEEIAEGIKLTVRYGASNFYTINVEIHDGEALPVQLATPKNPIKYVGSANDLPLDALFTGTLPEGASVMVFRKEGDDFTNLTDREPLDSTYTPYSVDDAGYVYDKANNKFGKPISDLKGSTLSLKGSSVYTGETGKLIEDYVYIAFVQNGIRISPDIKVLIVDALNITDWDDFTVNADGEASVSQSIVLLKDITMGFVSNHLNESDEKDKADYYSGSGGLTVKSTKAKPSTIYGNYRSLFLTGGTFSGMGFVELGDYATMKDLMIFGDTFQKVMLKADHDYGTNAVYAKDNATIENCYISGTRTPLAVGTENNRTTYEGYTITLRNVVLFGGSYANVDVRGGCTLKLEESVVTVNMPYGDDPDTAANENVVGTGIAVWIESDETKHRIEVDPKCDFQQYNFIAKNDMALLDPITVSKSGVTVDVLVDTMFTELFVDMNKDGEYLGKSETPVCGMIANCPNTGDWYKHADDCPNGSLCHVSNWGYADDHSSDCYELYELMYKDNIFTDTDGTMYVAANAFTVDVNTTIIGKEIDFGGTLNMTNLTGYGPADKTCKVKPLGLVTMSVGSFHVYTMDSSLDNEGKPNYPNNWKLFNNRDNAFKAYSPEQMMKDGFLSASVVRDFDME